MPAPLATEHSLYACPACLRVVAGLIEVEWHEGLVAVGPRPRCRRCEAGLEGAADDWVGGVQRTGRYWGEP